MPNDTAAKSTDLHSPGGEICLVQTSIGDYRQFVLDEVAQRLGDRFIVFCGKEYFYDSLKTRISSTTNTSYVSNIFLLGRRFLFQRLDFPRLFAAEICILELNPRILSVWLVLLVRRALGRRCVLWGHAWPRGGPQQASDIIRHCMRLCGTTLLVYTESEKAQLLEKMPRKRVIAAPNSLYKSADMRFDKDGIRTKFLYCGRLVKEKKVDLAIRALASMKDEDRSNTGLVIIGEGPEGSDLKKLAERLGVAKQVEFLGHIGVYAELKEVYSQCLGALSPGYVGLSAIQSFSFGLPILVAKDEPHAPEIEAVAPPRNAVMVESDSPDALAGAMLGIMNAATDWALKGPEIAADCRKKYSVEAMAGGIVTATRPGP